MEWVQALGADTRSRQWEQETEEKSRKPERKSNSSERDNEL
jgi:hypothetical protein